MYPTYVFGWPTGEETGPYLAVDLGGTNLRACHIELLGGGKYTIEQTKYKLTEAQKQGEGSDLFDFCAKCLKDFVLEFYKGRESEIQGKKLPLGFTFSYPCIQRAIDHGELVRWTKGFGAKNVEGRDAVELLNASLRKFEVPVEVVALINDATGTLIASAYVDTDTRAGVIFGTGCNAAYTEHIANITKLSHIDFSPDTEMAINCEWGRFDSLSQCHLPRTKYDITIDATSNKPGEQLYEKCIAGHYLGELYRLVVLDAHSKGLLFKNQEVSPLIKEPYSVDTSLLSEIEEHPTATDQLIADNLHFKTDPSEVAFLRRLAELIGTRSARFATCGIAAIVTKKHYIEKGCRIATDGSLYNKYPGYSDRTDEALIDIFGPDGKKIKTGHAEDGSGVGAAVIAAMTDIRNKKLAKLKASS